MCLGAGEEEESCRFSEQGGDFRFEILFVDAFAIGVQVDCVGEDETGFLGFEGFFAEGLEEIGGGILCVLRGSFEGFGGGEAGRRIGAEFDWCLGLLVWFGGHCLVVLLLSGYAWELLRGCGGIYILQYAEGIASGSSRYISLTRSDDC